MTVDQVESLMLPVLTLGERVAKRERPIAVYANTQYLGNRVVTRLYPEHYAKVVIARNLWMQYGGKR